jgi:hypothetical protein
MAIQHVPRAPHCQAHQVAFAPAGRQPGVSERVRETVGVQVLGARLLAQLAEDLREAMRALTSPGYGWGSAAGFVSAAALGP